MPATPQMNIPSSNKFSPFGGAISKSLLTPCRRVGLSRKRKTPNSTLKLPLDDVSFSEGPITSLLPTETTPVITKSDLNKRRSKMNFESPMEENGGLVKDEVCNLSSSLDATPVNAKSNLNKRKSKMNFDSPVGNDVSKDQLAKVTKGESKAKRSLSLADAPLREVMDPNSSKNEETDRKSAPTTLLNSENEKLEESMLATPKNTKFEEEKIPLQTENRPISPLGEDDSSSCDSFVMPKSKKSKVLYDSDEDFLPSNKNKPKLKRTKSETPRTKKTELKLISKVKSESMVNCLKDCKINLHKMSEDEIMCIENKHHAIQKVTNDSSDDEVVAKVRRKKIVVISDDDDDFQRSQKTPITPLRDNDFVKNSKKSEVKIVDSQINCEKDEKTLRKKTSFVDILEDEEDAFTSTPDRNKNEKKDLIEKITVLEKQIKDKRKILENLKQASVYKSIHKIEDLEKLTEKYRVGCIDGLKGLLSQLQAHGPMNMSTLLNNLRIPPEMVTRLSMNIES